MNPIDAAWRVLKEEPPTLPPVAPDTLPPVAPAPEAIEDPTHLGIIGSRNLADYDLFKDKVDEWVQQNGRPHSIISGGQRGADTFARIYAEENEIPFTEHHHNTYRHMGSPRMYHHRNQLVVDDSTHLLAFPSRYGRGPQSTMLRADKKGIPVTHHFEEDM